MEFATGFHIRITDTTLYAGCPCGGKIEFEHSKPGAKETKELECPNCHQRLSVEWITEGEDE